MLSKLKEKFKGMETTSSLIEKISGSKKESTENVALPERVLRSKRSSTEKDIILAKKNKLTATVSVRLPKLSNSELMSSSGGNVALSPAPVEAKEEAAASETAGDENKPAEATTAAVPAAADCKEEDKPKLKRRKTRNRTGFPVKKKRRLKKGTIAEGKLESGAEKVDAEADTAESTVEDDCPPIVRDESAALPIVDDDWSDDDIPLARRLAPVLQPIVSVPISTKKEISKPEVKTVKSSSRKASTATTEKLKNDGNSNKTLPSRASVRIHSMKLQEEEEEAAKKQAEKKKAAVTKKSGTKEKEPIEKRELRPKSSTSATDNKKPPVLKKEEPKKVVDKVETKGKATTEIEVSVDGDVEKESKQKEETDKEEMR